MSGAGLAWARRPLGAGMLSLLVWACLPGLAQADSDPAWHQLSPSQQQQLAPLRRDWSSIEAGRKQKWLHVAGQLESMPPEQRQRVQQRMAEWARLPASERSRARQQFQETRQLSLDERQARWLEYQALPSEQRQALVRQADQPPAASSRVMPGATPSSTLQSKHNTMPLPDNARGKAVAPAVVQARPGATTNPMSKAPEPSRFQQPGMPKIAATPDFVDPTTLQPRRGAQAAAVEKKSGNGERRSAQ